MISNGEKRGAKSEGQEVQRSTSMVLSCSKNLSALLRGMT